MRPDGPLVSLAKNSIVNVVFGLTRECAGDLDGESTRRDGGQHRGRLIQIGPRSQVDAQAAVAVDRVLVDAVVDSRLDEHTVERR